MLCLEANTIPTQPPGILPWRPGLHFHVQPFAGAQRCCATAPAGAGANSGAGAERERQDGASQARLTP
jgi:hypothetical protein